MAGCNVALSVSFSPADHGLRRNMEKEAQHGAYSEGEDTYNFVYILHPKAVTGFSWRKKSRKMPL